MSPRMPSTWDWPPSPPTASLKAAPTPRSCSSWQLSCRLWGISVNAIAPPATRTDPMMEYVDSLGAMGLTGEQLDEFRAAILEPEEVAPLAGSWPAPKVGSSSGTVLSMTTNGPTILRGPSQDDPEPELGAAFRRLFN